MAMYTLIVRIPALVIVAGLVLAGSALANDEDGSSVSVKLKNQLNSTSNSYYSSGTNTSIKIHQTGEGTSEVRVNGTEYKLEGPGDLSVNENTSSASTPVPTVSEPSPAPTEVPSPTPEEVISPEPEAEEIPQPEQMDVEDKIDKLREWFEDFFQRLSAIFNR